MLFGLIFAVAAIRTEVPLYHWRFRDADTQSPVWEKTLAMLDRHPGAIDAVWFSTGIGIPSLDWHREQAKSLSRAADDLRRRGIEPSLQIQATIGHSDSACAKGPASVKKWGGWTGPDGTECELCSCPRQPEFRAYWESVARIYAEFHPPRIWIDDDLRPYGHAPASPWSASFSAATMGCWCSLCLGEFNREAGGAWTRETLREALGKSADLQAKWERFQFESIAGLAFAIAKSVHGVSPETEMGLQQCRHWDDNQRIVYEAMARATGKGVCARPGGGAYFDYSPIDQIEKAYSVCEQMRMLATLPNLSVACPEIESFPRVFNSRTGQGVLLEALEAIPMGVNALSLLVANTRLEDVSFYERTYMDKLARNREFFLKLIAACRGAVPSGLVAEPDLYQKNQWAMTLGIPLVRGRCHELGRIELAKEDVPRLSSSDLLALYRRADELSGGRLPAIPCEPVSGWLLPVQHEDGRLACAVFVNTRIDTSFPFRLRVRGVPPGTTRATWRALGGEERDVPILREKDGAFVTVPSVSVWNGGYLVF